MTLVKMVVQRPAVDGLVSSSGRAEWRPTARRVEGDAVVMPAAFAVELTEGVADVLVAPSGPGWCWKVTEYVTGGLTRYVAVPDVAEIAYTDLIDVDPATLDPSAVPEAAWWAVAEGMTVSGEQAAQAATTAVEAAGVATTAAGTATSAATTATSAAGSATSSASAAGVSAGAAAGSASAAGMSATSAAGSATAAAGSDSTAGTAAGTATAAATTATGAATTATNAASTATTKASEAAASATTAQQWATGFSAGTATPLATGAAPTLAITGAPGAKRLDLGIPAGAVGPPGGWVAAAEIGTAHLDTMLSPGLFKQGNGANTTTANGYPFTKSVGCLVKTSLTGTGSVEQELTIVTSTVPAVYTVWRRRSVSGVFGFWKSFASTRTVQTAGRVIYAWDEVNEREQLIYGDSGARNVLSLLDPSITAAVGGRIEVVRTDGWVELVISKLVSAASIPNGIVALTLPSGFAPRNTQLYNKPWYGGVETAQNRAIINADGRFQIYGWVAGAETYGTISWKAAFNWPTTLPGDPVGTIANL